MSGQNALVLDNCSATNASWSYDRTTGRIKNKATEKCISAKGYPSMAASMETCLPAASTKEEQVWSWNPETGRIKNPLGAVLTVTDATPKAFSSAGTTYAENAWRLRQQAWRSDGKETCAGVLCVRKGPEAWNWGSIRKVVDGLSDVTSRYPLDFNIFAYDEVSGFYDIENPVAVANFCSASGFSVNRKGNTQGPALVVGGNSDLQNGAIDGFPYLSWWDGLGAGVRVGADGYEAPDTNPINFEMPFLDLDAWSQSLAGLSSKTAWIGPSGPGPGAPYLMKSVGAPANPDLEVFNIKSDDFRSIYSLQFDTPAPTILINVDTSQELIPNVFITNMGISGADGKKILWNFPGAAYVEIRAVGLPGSILAPRAWVHPDWGWIQGTTVAWRMVGTAEYHGDPLTTYGDIK